LAAFHAIRSFASRSEGISIKILIDNSTAVFYINKGGGTKSRNLNSLAVDIAKWCEARQISIVVEFLPGYLNTIADHESRRDADPSDWKLCFKMFRSLSRLWVMQFFVGLERPTSSICIMDPQPGAYNLRLRLRSELEEFKRLCLPAIFSDLEMPDKDQTGESGSSNGLSTVDMPILASGSVGTESRRPRNFETNATTDDVGLGRATPTDDSEIIPSLRLDVIRRNYVRQDFSTEVVDLLLEGNRSSTMSAYQSAWTSWSNWCI